MQGLIQGPGGIGGSRVCKGDWWGQEGLVDLGGLARSVWGLMGLGG